MVDKGVCEKAAGKNCGIYSRETNIQTLYRCRADGGVQLIPKVVGPIPRPQSDEEGGRAKDRTMSSVRKLISIS